MEILNQQQIIEKRLEIEQELTNMLEETGSAFSLDHIKGLSTTKTALTP